MSGISTHILDTSAGRPAAGVTVQLEAPARDGEGWALLAEGVTDGDGRCRPLLPGALVLPGPHRMRFLTGPYFAANGLGTLFLEVTISFQVEAERTGYHIPLLLNPFGYTTYLGS